MASARPHYKLFQLPMPQPAHCDGCTTPSSSSASGSRGPDAGGFISPVADPAHGRHHPAPHPGDHLTAQCTDQCVVIACSNPDHPESLCPRTGPHTQCDFVCDEAVDCPDCHGFDAFLQCCDDYHPYAGPTTPPATMSSAWETAFAAWCASCAEPTPLPPPSTGSARDAADKAIDGGAHHPSQPKNALQQHHHSQMASFGSVEESSFVGQPRSSTPSAAHSPVQAYSCMWAACNASFTSLSELVGHVNLDHLAHSSSASTPSSSLSGAETPNFHSDGSSSSLGHNNNSNISPISCLWNNCNSSYFASSDNSFELLANHLLNEHLGADVLTLPPAQSYEQQLQRELQRQQAQQQQQQQQHQRHHPQHDGHAHQQQQNHHHQQQQQQQHAHQQHHHPQPSHHQQQQQQHHLGTDDNTYEATMRAQLVATLAGSSKHLDAMALDPFPTSSAFDHRMLDSEPLSQLTQSQPQSQTQLPIHTHAQTLQSQIPLDQVANNNNSKACPAGAPHTHECRWKACGATFDSCDALTTHISDVHIGSGKARYECFWEECVRNGAQGFQSKQKISRHVQSHTGHRPFQCSICHQNFSEAATLQQHTRRHTQEKPYVCDHPGCGKSFAITGALTIHKRTHNGDKPFKCSYCDRGFAESSNLSKHLRTHTGARPYICSEPGCGKAFARPDQLNRHKSVHKKQTRGVGGRAMIEA